jgi:tetratricopeptide (TPR) repeat protein
VVADEIEELDIDAVPELVLEDSSDNVPQPLDPQDSTGYADVELLGARAPAARAHEPGPVPEIDDSLLPPADDAGGDDGSDDITTDDAPPAALLGDLEQVDFFIDQGLLEDATAMLDEIDPTYARHAAVLERRQRVANARATEHGPEPSATALDLETPDFESATPAPVRRTPVPEPRPAEATPTAPVGGGAPDPAAVVSPRVIVAGGAADLGTHADLGIAYKEMGLHDAAIKEFGLLAQDPSREVFALTMIGDCYEARGAPAEALVHYKKALNRPGVRDDEAMQLYYKLGRVFQALGDRDEALYFFEKVLKRDARFEDVEQRVSSLRGAPPGGARRS